MRDEVMNRSSSMIKKGGFDGGLFGKGKYKLWVLAAILLLATWTMFTAGSITLTLDWKQLSAKLDSPAVYDDLDLLEVEEREKVVRRMWDVYTQSKSTVRLPKFWHEAFEAAYEDMMSDSTAVRDAALSEIAKMSLRSLELAAKSQSLPNLSNHRETGDNGGPEKKKEH